MLKIEHLYKSYGTSDILKDINLEINKNERVVIIGPSGSGKSTLLRCMNLITKPTSGSITLDGNDITREPEYKRAHYIGRIFQNPLLGTAGKMSLEDNMIICEKKGYKGLKISLNRKKREQFRQQLAVLGMGLEDRLTDNVEQFSGGQRQALTLLMAVMSHPSLLLLDEHTAALDPANAEVIMNLTRRFAEEYNLTVMMITHNMNHALAYGNRLLMMDAGEIIMDLSGEEKSKLTADAVVERFRQIKQGALSDALLLH